MAYALRELARELDAQADLQESAGRLDGPDGTEPRFLPRIGGTASSHEA
jgi:hypothetical protein